MIPRFSKHLEILSSCLHPPVAGHPRVPHESPHPDGPMLKGGGLHERDGMARIQGLAFHGIHNRAPSPVITYALGDGNRINRYSPSQGVLPMKW